MILLRLTLALLFAGAAAFAAKAPIPIAELARTTPVDFDREVAPFLSDNCLSCHCETTKKGGLNLETPALMLKGGENGPAIVPKKAADSLLLQAAAHLDDDLAMPPRDNRAKAKNLTPEQLGLLKLWIDEGAVASPKRERVVTWQPLPAHLGAIFAVAMSGDGQFAACARANRIFIYHVPTGRLVASEAAHRDQVNALAFSPDGTLMASSAYREVKLWQRTKIAGKAAPAPAVAQPGKIARSDGSRAIMIEGNVAKLCAADGKVIAELRGNRLAREAIDERERALLVAAGNAAFRKESFAAAEKAAAAAKERTERDRRETQRKQAADKIEPADKALAAAEDAATKAGTAKSLAETELQLSKAEEQKTAAEVVTAKAAADAAEAARKGADDSLQAARTAATTAEQPIRAAAFSPDGATLATAGDDRLVHTWSAETGAAIDVLAGHTAAIAALSFAPDGTLVSTASDGAALSWNLQPVWKLVRTIGTGDAGSPLTDRVNALAFAPDGKQVATGSGEPSRGGEIKLWSVADGTLVRDFPKIHSDAVFSLEFSPDGKLLASGAADKMARIVEIATGKAVRSFEGHTHHVLGVSWSADGRTLATAGADGMVKVWDAATGDRKKNIEGYDKEVTAVRFVGASANLLTSSGDSKVRLVGLDGKEVRVFPEVADFVQSAAVSADGRLVVAGGQDSVLRIWSAADGGKLATFAPAK